MSKGNNQLKIRIMKEAIKKLENVLSKVTGVEIDLTLARTNMVTLAWGGRE